MGTPDFAVVSLEHILSAGHEVVLAVTQPDKARGRGGKVQFPPVKEAALAHGIPVFQPERIRDDRSAAELANYKADAAVVAAYGQILPESVLTMPRYGCLNVHASLLPAYRGAAPIQRAILDGCKVTGVAIMQMDKGLDTGDILTSCNVPIADNDTGGSLHDKLAEAGGKLLVQTLDELAAGNLNPTAQGGPTTRYASMLTREMGRINWKESAETIARKVRALSPWPGAYTAMNGRTLKIWRAQALAGSGTVQGEPGSVASHTDSELLIMTGDGILQIEEVQIEGKKRMDIEPFLRGVHDISMR